MQNNSKFFISDMYKCNKCLNAFENEEDLINHNISSHSSKRLQNTEKNVSNKKSKLVCDLCQKTFSDTSKLKRHLRHCLRCKQCGKKFQNNIEFQKHRQEHFILKKKDKGKKSDDEDNDDDDDGNVYERTAFSRKLIDRTWNIKGYNDPMKTLQSLKRKILRYFFNTFQELASPIKFAISMKLKTYKMTPENEKEYNIMGLYSGMHFLMNYGQAEFEFEQCAQNLYNNFEKWNSEGSGINLEKVESITLKVGKTRILKAASYIPTPKAFPRSLINVKNFDDR